MVDGKYLLLRGNSYFVRVTIPPSLRPVYKRKTHIIRALKTKSLSVAQHRRHAAVAAIKEQFKTLTADAAKSVAAKLHEIEAKWQQRIRRDKFGFQMPLNKAEQAEYELDKTVAYQLGSARVAESLGMPSPKGTPLNHLEESWFEAAKLTNRTRIHYRHCRELLAAHLRREGLPEAIESVDSKVALSFRKYLVAQKTHPTTGSSYLGGCRARFQMLIQEEVIEPPNPFLGISMKGSNRGEEAPRRPFAAKELVQIMTGDMPEPLFTILSLLICEGLRRNELLAMRCHDVEGDWIRIREGKSSSSVRRLPVASILKQGLARLIKGRAPDDFLIELGDRTIHAKANRVTMAFKAYRQDVAGIKDSKVVLHSTRHTWASLALENGVQFHVVQACLGHAPAGGQTVTLGYGHAKLLDAPKREAIEAVVKALPAEVRREISKRFGKGQ